MNEGSLKWAENNNMTYNEIKNIVEGYNWDDGFEIPCQLLSDEKCDLALALEIFYSGDGYGYMIDLEHREGRSREWLEFISKLYCDIEAGRYQIAGNTYQIPLNKVQRHKLRKNNIPIVFLTDL